METTDNVELQTGMDVFSLDGEKVGKVVELDNSQITVEKGLFFPHDYVIPMSAVESADDQSIYLNINKDDALNQRWSAGDASSWDANAAVAPATYDDREVATTDTGMVGSADAAAGIDATNTATRTSSDDTLTIPVHEEELTATKRTVDAGDVVINTKVVSEDRTLQVPITEERVRVTRRAVDRDATGNDAAFQGGTINVPVQTEQVDMQKRVHVAEEVEVAKEATQKTQQVSGTVRREVVDVADNTDVDVSDGTSGTVAQGTNR